MKQLRIIFTIISAVFISTVIPVGALVSWTWAGSCALFALLFYALMILCKQKQEEQEEKQAKSFPTVPLSDENKDDQAHK